MKSQESEDRIVFLSVPESLRRAVGNFTINPSIPIPVEIPPGEERLNLENLSWEMMISGMIKVVARAPEAEDADYYRAFVAAVKPDIVAEFTEAALLKSRNGDFALALEIMEALTGLFPGAPTVLLNKAVILEDQAEAIERSGQDEAADGAFELAFEAYKQVLAVEPPHAPAFFGAGFFYMKRKNFAKAKETFQRFLALPDAEPGRKAKAANIVKEIDSRELDDDTFQQAFDFIRLGEEEKGLERIRDFLERHPKVWNGWFLLGWGLRRLGRFADAAAAFRETVELGGDSCDTRNELAICLMETGDLAQARKELETALRQEPENAKVISNLGALALKMGDKDEAAGFFRIVLELSPEDPIAKKFLDSLGG